jgi:Fe-S cluster assembly iron-binding protein IscA
MALDEPKETDNVFNVNSFQFILDKDFYEKVKPVKVDFMGYGFKISSNLQLGAGAAGGCGSCGSGSCETSSHSH